MTRSHFDDDSLAAAQHDLVIGVLAGTEDHKITPVWAVVVDGRIFIRSWAHAERSWFHAFEKEPIGVVELRGGQHPVRAVTVRDTATLDAVDQAYRLKYHTPASLKYVEDMTGERSRATTTELVPVRRDAGDAPITSA